jgi:hypothetical protein
MGFPLAEQGICRVMRANPLIAMTCQSWLRLERRDPLAIERQGKFMTLSLNRLVAHFAQLAKI